MTTTLPPATAALVAEIEKLPRGARAAVADFFEAGSQPPIRSTPVLLAFVELIREVDRRCHAQQIIDDKLTSGELTRLPTGGLVKTGDAEADARGVIAETVEESKEYQVNP